jgi:hypothetical protein
MVTQPQTRFHSNNIHPRCLSWHDTHVERQTLVITSAIMHVAYVHTYIVKVS